MAGEDAPAWQGSAAEYEQALPIIPRGRFPVPTPASSTSGTGPASQPQRMLVLVGVVGSGKSTFAAALARYDPSYVRVCQDDLGNRQSCESLATFALSQGKNVVVDRQNFDLAQRRTWIDLARAAGRRPRPDGTVRDPVEVVIVDFATPPDECARRLQRRIGHPTIDNPVKALELLDQFLLLFESPRPSEGFDKSVTIGTQGLPFPPTPESIAGILELIAVTPSLTRPGAFA